MLLAAICCTYLPRSELPDCNVLYYTLLYCTLLYSPLLFPAPLHSTPLMLGTHSFRHWSGFQNIQGSSTILYSRAIQADRVLVFLDTLLCPVSVYEVGHMKHQCNGYGLLSSSLMTPKTRDGALQRYLTVQCHCQIVQSVLDIF